MHYCSIVGLSDMVVLMKAPILFGVIAIIWMLLSTLLYVFFIVVCYHLQQKFKKF